MHATKASLTMHPHPLRTIVNAVSTLNTIQHSEKVLRTDCLQHCHLSLSNMNRKKALHHLALANFGLIDLSCACDVGVASASNLSHVALYDRFSFTRPLFTRLNLNTILIK